MKHWQPTATIENLRKRAELMATVRQFFAERDVLEVETPSLSNGTVTDVHLHTFNTTFIDPSSPENRQLFLQTSPEYAMKRLLCAGSGAIYQICKAFRNEESGRNHNPEFTMLEWYRPDFDHHQLMAEMDVFLQSTLGSAPAEKVSYQQAFMKHTGIDPLKADLKTLQAFCADKGFADFASTETDKDTLLQLIFCESVEPNIGQQVPCMVHGFPASQAALARLDNDDPRIACRFEVYFKGVELANGFYELCDPQEQAERFTADNAKRVAMGLAPKPIDEYFLAALAQGLPDCSGVALGIDRLLMLSLGAERLSDVISFTVENA